MLECEQQKRNDRELRRSNNILQQQSSSNDTPSDPNAMNATSADCKYPCQDDLKQATTTNNHSCNQNLFINDTQPTRYNEPFDLNAIANAAKEMEYYTDDDEVSIKQRIRRCLNKAKKRQWKKADAALGKAQ